jgi:hypothetical protein
MRWTIALLMLALALVISAPGSVALADEGECDVACCDAGCGSCCGNGCCGGLVSDIELTWLRYFQEGGVTDAVGLPAETDYEFAPRFVLGYVAPSGLGARMRYWELDAATVSDGGDAVGANAYTLDWELFQEYCLGCDTTLELALGLRYSELWLDSTDLFTGEDPLFGLYGFSGFGGTMAAEVNRNVLCGRVYARGRLSLLMGDAAVHETNLRTLVVMSDYADDCTAVQTELGLGYEICRCTRLGLVTVRTGVEWQNWANMAIADAPFGGVGDDDQMEDAGFAGFVLGFGLER